MTEGVFRFVQTRIRVLPARDRRDAAGQGECTGAVLELVALGEHGAVVVPVQTGWVPRPLLDFIDADSAERLRRSQPGVDGDAAHLMPQASVVVAHSRRFRENFDPHSYQSNCLLLNRQPCWARTSYLNVGPVLAALVSGGDKAAFAALADHYRRLITDQAVLPAPTRRR